MGDTGSAIDFIDRTGPIDDQMHYRRRAPVFLHQDFQPVGQDALLGDGTGSLGKTRRNERDCNEKTEYGLPHSGKVQR